MPPKEFSEMSKNETLLLNKPKELGIVPVKLFLFRDNVLKLVIVPIEEGISPAI